jgi:hypothetical protein
VTRPDTEEAAAQTLPAAAGAGDSPAEKPLLGQPPAALQPHRDPGCQGIPGRPAGRQAGHAEAKQAGEAPGRAAGSPGSATGNSGE